MTGTERVERTEQELFRHALEASKLGVWDWQPATDQCYTSLRLLLLLGLDPERRPCRMAELRSQVHPDDRSALDRALEDHLMGRTPHHQADYRTRHSDGRWIWLEERALVVERDAAGRARRVVGTCGDITERISAQRGAEWLALHDSLTALPNRALFRRELRRALCGTSEHRVRVGLLLLDLDRFKEVNDRCGHQAGDRLLAHAARRLRASVRSADVVARIGGDEFAVIIALPPTSGAFAAVADRLLGRLRVPFEVDGEQVAVTASGGLAVHLPGLREQELLARADRALYEAKAAGRATWRAGTVNTVSF